MCMCAISSLLRLVINIAKVIIVGVLTPGVIPTSEFVCMFSFSDGYARWTQGFILVRAKEGPTSSGGREFVLACT